MHVAGARATYCICIERFYVIFTVLLLQPQPNLALLTFDSSHGDTLCTTSRASVIVRIRGCQVAVHGTPFKVGRICSLDGYSLHALTH